MRNCVCAICGVRFYSDRGTCKYCSDECRREAARRRYRENSQLLARAHDPPPRKKKPAPPLSVAEVARLAQAAGMTYGKYVATHREVSE